MNRDVAAATEHDRMLGNVLMIGVVAELDAPNALVKVSVNGLTTDWIPWTVRRAGPNATWSAPEVGEQVVVGCPYGDPSQGFVLGSLYQQAHPAPATTADKERVTFSDGASVEYDRATHTLAVDTTANGAVTIICKTANVQASESITLDTPDVFVKHKLHVAEDLDVQGSTAVKAITSNGKDISDQHKHSGVQTGGGQSGPVV
ncbi:phage baseplate assembly protein V [Bradyrhizobium sp. 613_E4_N2_2]|uniref:phage baseplate assembly protein V n=1 Tax=Bradyrhizobium sp. 613_E4_N2_2 TaxID=3240371 RepID=UPI003F8B450C